jgi:hypothetical protein
MSFIGDLSICPTNLNCLKLREMKKYSSIIYDMNKIILIISTQRAMGILENIYLDQFATNTQKIHYHFLKG